MPLAAAPEGWQSSHPGCQLSLMHRELSGLRYLLLSCLSFIAHSVGRESGAPAPLAAVKSTVSGLPGLQIRISILIRSLGGSCAIKFERFGLAPLYGLIYLYAYLIL